MLWNKIKSSWKLDVRDANNRKVQKSESINLAVDVFNRVKSVNLNVVERLRPNILLGCHYGDRYIEEIKPRKGLVEKTTEQQYLLSLIMEERSGMRLRYKMLKKHEFM